MDNIIFHIMHPDELKQLIIDAVNIAVDNKTNPQPQENEDQLIKLNEASRLLGVSSVTMHTWKKAGLIPFYRISNKIYFKKNELINSLKQINKRTK